MKFFGFLFPALFSCLLSLGQKEDLYYLDHDFRGTDDAKKAKYLLSIKNYNDTLWQYDTYRIIGPLLSSEYFKDKDATIAQGRFRYYGADGRLDSIAQYSNNLKQGSSYYFNDTGAVYRELVYDKGVLKEDIDALNRKLEIVKKDSSNSSQDVVFSKIETESEFEGGLPGWARYLNKNLKYPERAINNNIRGTVVIQFIVDKEGKVDALEIFRSVEYSIDKVALDIIRKSPRWVPAVQNGWKVKSYKRQPIVFALN